VSGSIPGLVAGAQCLGSLAPAVAGALFLPSASSPKARAASNHQSGIDCMDIQLPGLMRAVTRLFLSNRSQAVRIPAHLRLPDSVKEVEVRACGQERIISPSNRSWDSFFIDGPTVPADFLEERASQQQNEREPF